MEIRYLKQSNADLQKNFNRIKTLVDKNPNDKDKQIQLAENQAMKITTENKAYNRAMAAKELGHEHLFDVFFRRAYELGSVSKQDYRSYKLEKLGL